MDSQQVVCIDAEQYTSVIVSMVRTMDFFGVCDQCEAMETGTFFAASTTVKAEFRKQGCCDFGRKV